MTLPRLAHSVLVPFHSLRRHEPERPLFTFVDDRGRDEETLTAGALAGSAEAVAESLRGWGFEPGDRALLVYPPGADFVRALIGCLVAGVVPVPVYPPNPLRLKHDLPGFNAIVDSCRPKAILTNGAYSRAKTVGAVGGLFDANRPKWPELRWHHTDRCARTPGAPVGWHTPADPSETALLQYTSGSTSAPKGVEITHGNLAHEVWANAVDLSLGEDARGVFWLPQYHDFGLISVILSTIAGNSHTHLLSPMTFLERPSVWFDVMSRVRATHTAAPNFAFEVAVRRTTPEQRATWDLSSVYAFMSAAEPIRMSTVDKFFTAFDASGLRRDAFYPAYGLAEHTVSVSMGGRAMLECSRSLLEKGVVRSASANGDRARLVGCGRLTKAEMVVRIVDPGTRALCAPGVVGEIWVDSPTKAKGYFGLAEETTLTFHAELAEPDGRGYLRTGDLGFLREGELFVTGRLKDLIILNGRNLYPEDVESAVRDCHAGIRPGGLAAFAVPSGNGSERLVIFVETRDKGVGEEITAEVRVAVAERFQLACEVVVGPPGLVRKTTSGKVRRGACRAAHLEASADAAA
ncbi:hypothetical protein Lesp02_01910 [Lentzea sp. NBRC 105346]|uniref:fatty acyl-AMP ligase n=1 Tax=Lentzea sp. NBRC 105346 TaxID=3032205 RepID=UPI0024A4B70B|nr:fatty acyl-AMP ligase [Lentzea sp. NBRC 105346]GLZ28001.1 hypothetical protein Lesp02_01910 [Lentzea sp. NBRC 105346]